MTNWPHDELQRIGEADELAIAPARADGTRRAPTTIWVVRDGDELYVRAYRGRQGSWWRAARAGLRGRISAGGVERDVAFAEVDDPTLNDRVDAAYRGKYGSSGPYVAAMVSEQARATTLAVRPSP
ncbi:DUF2255 family protein [Streptomyces sp. NBC_00669]|uniref:DUF2255 family protein n=1 Tax=unclassified Streptomyces TaxID=2593676 RepID=UPI002E328EB0|nr:DUF2255 family protein [Streptomyces sp. NBC_00669]